MKKQGKKLMAFLLAFLMTVSSLSGNGVAVKAAGYDSLDPYRELIVTLQDKAGNLLSGEEVILKYTESRKEKTVSLGMTENGKLSYDVTDERLDESTAYYLQLADDSGYEIEEPVELWFAEDWDGFYIDSIGDMEWDDGSNDEFTNELTLAAAKKESSAVPSITSMSADPQSVDKTGGSIVVTIIGENLPETFYVERKTESDVYTSGTPFTATGTETERKITIELPSVSRLTNKEASEWNVRIGLSEKEYAKDTLVITIMDQNVSVAAKKTVESLIAEKNTMAAGKYTEATWNVYEAAIDKAKTLSAEDNNAEASYQAAITAIQKAKAALEEAELASDEEKAALETAIADVKNLKEEEYTTESWKLYQEIVSKIISEAEDLLSSEYVTKVKCNNAKQTLEEAKTALIKNNPAITSVKTSASTVSKDGETVIVTVKGVNLPDTLYYKRKYLREDIADQYTNIDSSEAVEATLTDTEDGTGKQFCVTLPSVSEYKNAKAWVVAVDLSQTGIFAKETAQIQIQKISSITVSTTDTSAVVEGKKVTVTINGNQLPDEMSFQWYYYTADDDDGHGNGKFTSIVSGTDTEKTAELTIPEAATLDDKAVIGWKIGADFLDGAFDTKSALIASSVTKQLNITAVDSETKEVVANLPLGMTCDASCAPYYFQTDENGNASCNITGGNAVFTLKTTDESNYTTKNPTAFFITKDALNTSYVQTIDGEKYDGAIVTLLVEKKESEGIQPSEPTNPVEPIKVSSIKLTGISNKLAAGKTVKLTAAVSPENAANKKLTWTSSNTKYATVDGKGNVTLKAAGAGKKVTITAAATDGSGKKATYAVTIMKHAVKSIRVTGISNKLAAGKTVQLSKTVTVTGSSANKTLKWSSSNTKYATVDAKGNVTLKAAGAGKKVTITAAATDGSGKKATYAVTIMKHAVKSIRLKAAKASMKAGSKIKVTATVTTTGSNANKSLKWSSSNTKYATVSAKGVVTAKKAGKGKTVTITAAAADGSGKKNTVKIKIK